MSTVEFESFGRLLAGQYALEREIGRGGMGIVYLARDVRLDRPVAIKTLPPNLANDATIRERFLREARTAANLTHPHIVPIYRADEIDGQVFFVMGYVDGESVAERIRRQGRLDAREVLREMRDVASALGYASGHGVVHRDVKAENILVERDSGAAMVTDFGIARLAEAAPLTATGQVLGTVYYMSPEQVGGEPLDGRSDLYSLGVVGFYALSGRFPFDATMASAVLVAHVTRPAPAMLTVNPDVPRALAEIVDRCLAKDPNARFQTGEELAESLTRVEAEVARDAERTGLSPDSPALLSEDEAQAIWARAAELQAATGLEPRPVAIPKPRDAAHDAARTSGYAPAAVRDAALEAGIPAQYVEHAMVERGLVRAPSAASPVTVTVTDLSPKRSWVFGAPRSIEFEAVITGEMPEADVDLAIDTIRRHMKQAGAVTAVGRSLTWTSMEGSRSAHVSVLSRNGKTTVRAVENLGGSNRRLRVLGMVGGVYVWGGVASALLAHHPALAAGVGAAAFATVFGIVRTVITRSANKHRDKLRALTEEVAAQVRDSAATATGALASGAPARLSR